MKGATCDGRNNPHPTFPQTTPTVPCAIPKRNRRGGACVPARTSAQRRFHTKNRFCTSRIVCGVFNDGCALVGRHGQAHRHRPYQTPSYFSTQSHTNKIRPCVIHPKRNKPSMYNPSLPISTKPRGVPIPHRGYTFNSAGLASVTQPTLGNDASEEATPLGVVLFLITHHYHTVPNEWFPACKLILKSTMPMA